MVRVFASPRLACSVRRCRRRPDRSPHRRRQPSARSRLAARLCRATRIRRRPDRIDVWRWDRAGHRRPRLSTARIDLFRSRSGRGAEHAEPSRAGCAAPVRDCCPLQPARVAASARRRQTPAPAYYQLVPAPQAGAAGRGSPSTTGKRRRKFEPCRLHPHPVGEPFRSASPAQVDPRYVASVSSGQFRGSQSQPAGYRIAAAPPAAQSDPRYTGSVATRSSY